MAEHALADLIEGYHSGRLDPVEVTHAFLERIAASDPALHAFITVTRERALADAERSRARWRSGHPASALDGMPVALKDNIDVAGVACTAGTAAYRSRIPELDAAVARQLAAAGAVLLGKLNMHEAALGATTDNPVYGRCINPLRAGYTPGGSSGGSGAAVAARLCVAALGTDTMGSVRVPASYCGVFGYKPTTGALSTQGIVPLSATLDSVGPLAGSARDAALVASALLERRQGQRPLRDLRIGTLRQLEVVELEAPVQAAYDAFLAALSAAGARLVPVDLEPWNPGRARRAGLLISEAEGFEYWRAAIGESLDGLSAPLAAMLRYPRLAGEGKLRDAYQAIAAIRGAAARAFEGVDLLVLPTTPQRSFAHTDIVPVDQADCTALANFTRSPAFAIPRAADGGLPASVQLMAAPGNDPLLLDLADAIDGLQGIE